MSNQYYTDTIEVYRSHHRSELGPAQRFSRRQGAAQRHGRRPFSIEDKRDRSLPILTGLRPGGLRPRPAGGFLAKALRALAGGLDRSHSQDTIVSARERSDYLNTPNLRLIRPPMGGFPSTIKSAIIGYGFYSSNWSVLSSHSRPNSRVFSVDRMRLRSRSRAGPVGARVSCPEVACAVCARPSPDHDGVIRYGHGGGDIAVCGVQCGVQARARHERRGWVCYWSDWTEAGEPGEVIPRFAARWIWALAKGRSTLRITAYGPRDFPWPERVHNLDPEALAAILGPRLGKT